MCGQNWCRKKLTGACYLTQKQKDQIKKSETLQTAVWTCSAKANCAFFQQTFSTIIHLRHSHIEIVLLACKEACCGSGKFLSDHHLGQCGIGKISPSVTSRQNWTEPFSHPSQPTWVDTNQRWQGDITNNPRSFPAYIPLSSWRCLWGSGTSLQ